MQTRFSKLYRPIVLLTLLSVYSAGAYASPLTELVDTMAIPQKAMQTNNSWEELAKAKSVKWQWPYFESGAHGSEMRGKFKVGKSSNPHIGAGQVLVQGARTMMMSMDINVANLHLGLDALGKTKLIQINTNCDDNSVLNTVAFYQLVKIGYKPLYLAYQSSWGAGGDAGSEGYKLGYQLDDVLNIYPTACKAL